MRRNEHQLLSNKLLVAAQVLSNKPLVSYFSSLIMLSKTILSVFTALSFGLASFAAPSPAPITNALETGSDVLVPRGGGTFYDALQSCQPPADTCKSKVTVLTAKINVCATVKEATPYWSQVIAELPSLVGALVKLVAEINTYIGVKVLATLGIVGDVSSDACIDILVAIIADIYITLQAIVDAKAKIGIDFFLGLALDAAVALVVSTCNGLIAAIIGVLKVIVSIDLKVHVITLVAAKLNVSVDVCTQGLAAVGISI